MASAACGRARHRREDARPLVLERDLLELGGQGRRRERPRSREVRRREPAPRHQEVNGAGRAHPEDVAVGVAHPQQLRPAHDRCVVRLASQQHQLRGLQADEHLRRLAGVDLLARQALLHFLPVLVVGQLLEALRQRAGRGPRALHVGRLQPDRVVAQVVGLRRRVLEQIPVGVDRRLQIVLRDRRPDRVAVEVHAAPPASC